MFTMVKLGKNYVVDGKCVQYIPKKTMSLFVEGYMLDIISVPLKSGPVKY